MTGSLISITQQLYPWLLWVTGKLCLTLMLFLHSFTFILGCWEKIPYPLYRGTKEVRPFGADPRKENIATIIMTIPCSRLFNWKDREIFGWMYLFPFNWFWMWDLWAVMFSMLLMVFGISSFWKVFVVN